MIEKEIDYIKNSPKPPELMKCEKKIAELQEQKTKFLAQFEEKSKEVEEQKTAEVEATDIEEVAQQ